MRQNALLRPVWEANSGGYLMSERIKVRAGYFFARLGWCGWMRVRIEGMGVGPP